MATIMFNDNLHSDPRVWQVGTEAFGLWVMSVGYVSRNRCEVYPHTEALFTDTRGRLTPVLIAGEFWELADDDSGYRVLAPPMSADGMPAYRLSIPHSPDIPPEIRRAVFARDGHACLICGDIEDLTLDHIWPRSLGGEHTLENLRVLCRSCNSRKGAKV